jgi:uncharacterized protein (DUF1778 family)
MSEALKDKYLRVRLTAAQKAAFEAQAKSQSRTLSNWALTILVEAATMTRRHGRRP